MSTDRQANDVPPLPLLRDDCPLSAREQTRNLLIFGTNVSLIYLGAPVLYISITQAALFDKLNTPKWVANLPSTLYFWMTPLPIVVAWYFCKVRQIKPVLVTNYLLVAVLGGVVVGSLLLPTLNYVIPAVLLHAGVLGWALGVVATYSWEVIGRGVAESRRGQVLAFAFGIGPILAFAASLGSQAILTQVVFPWNFALLYGATMPIMSLAALLSTRFVVLYPPQEIVRPPFVVGVLSGFGEFVHYRILCFAALATILVCSGYIILNNMSLFTQQALGEGADKYVGYQNALRFGFKAVAGLALGWILTKTNPKRGLLITTGFCLASVVWVLTVPGLGYLFCFCLIGAGELFGVYFPNYILCCSAKSRMRRNMAFASMLNMPSGFVAVLFGLIADVAGLNWSFYFSIGILVVTLLMVQFLLPARPRPRESDMDVSDRALAKLTERHATVTG